MRLSYLLIGAVWAVPHGALRADCSVPVGCYEITGAVASCKVVRSSGEKYLQLEVPDARVEVSRCGQHEWSASQAEESATWLRSQVQFVAAKPSRMSCKSLGKALRAAYSPLCCDVLPFTGACAVPGTFIELRTTNE